MLSRTRSRASNQRPNGLQPALHDRSSATQGVLQRGVVRRLDFQPAVADPPDALEQAARRRPGGAFAVGVVDAAVAGAHEQPGLREPGHRTAQMGAIHGEDHELFLAGLVRALVADVNARCGPPCRPTAARAGCKGRQAGLAFREPADRPEGDPLLRLLPQRAEEEADEGKRPRPPRRRRPPRRSSSGRSSGRSRAAPAGPAARVPGSDAVHSWCASRLTSVPGGAARSASSAATGKRPGS